MLDIREQVGLAQFNTMGVGGNAKYFVRVNSYSEMLEAIEYANSNGEEFYLLGTGSNIIFDDNGYNGLVIHNKIADFNIEGSKLTIGSGILLNIAIMKLMNKDLGAFEKLFGIPGTIGGAIYQNAGAHGIEISDFFISGEVYSIEDKIVKTWNKEDFEFEYRSSKLRKNKGKYILLTAEFKLEKRSKEDIKANISEVSESRNMKPSGKSSGSFFKNPEGYFAGKLIEDCGLKGLKVGGAEVSTIHANYIMNINGAKACDIKELSDIIKTKVLEKYGVKLEEEVEFVK